MKEDKNKKSKLSIKSNKNKKQNKKNSIDKKKRINESFRKKKKNDENKESKYKKRNWKKYLDETVDVKDKIIKKKNYYSNKEFKEKNENYILAEINIEEENINKDIRIINSFEEFKREYNDLDYEEEDDYKYRNEKEIKDNCIIKINNRKIKFQYFYKFKEKGKFNIKYSFKKNIKNLACIFSECKSLTNIDLSNFNTQNVNIMNGMF